MINAELAELYLEESLADANSLIGAADALSESFATGSPARHKWLAGSIGKLQIANEELANALREFGGPIVTTNYDTLLEQATGRSTVTLLDIYSGSSRQLGGETVLHLHGVWDRADTAVLSSSDYDAVIENVQAQALQKAIATTNTLVLMGFGGGSKDPNLSRVLTWISKIFSDPSSTHYRVCKASEYKDAVVEHFHHNVQVEKYGDEYVHFTPFVKKLVAASNEAVVASTLEQAQNHLVSELRSRALHIADASNLSAAPSELVVIEPAFNLMQRSDQTVDLADGDDSKNGSNRRISGSSIVDDERFTVIAGDAQYGLTTALNWLLLDTSRRFGLTPIIVDASFANNRDFSVQRRIAKEAKSVGYDVKKNGFKGLAIAVDNINPEHSAFSKIVAGLATIDAGRMFLGCRTGSEHQLLSAFNSRELVVRYVGPLGSKDIIRYAKAAAPEAWEPVAKAVMDAVRNERLPRNPFTIAQLVAIMVRGGSVSSIGSTTRLLEKYLDILLGRFESADEARSDHLEECLIRLSRELFQANTAGMAEVEAASLIDACLQDIDSDISPIDAVVELLDRRLLVRNESGVVFAQTSYLWFFAAKSAEIDSTVRERVLERPLYYGGILCHYAGLVRRDSEPLRVCKEILGPSTLVPEINPILIARSSSATVGSTSARHRDDPNRAGGEDGAEADLFDIFDTSEVEPFPSIDERSMTEEDLLARGVEVASIVLRNSTLVSDLTLKRELLRAIMVGCSQLSVKLHQSDGFRELLGRALEEVLGDAPTTSGVDDALDRACGFVFVGGVSHGLASGALANPAREFLDSEVAVGFEKDLLAAGAAILILLSDNDAGFDDALGVVLRLKNTSLMQDVVSNLLAHRYYSERSESKANALSNVLVRLYEASRSFDNAAQRKSLAAAFRQDLAGRRTMRVRAPLHLAG
ncbi:SIR2 family NAD-dependent protein deacylase [Isoptericola jiangsuensis]|uniref:SIR2 family NAD-dependent protein deacylase n=1 Tax=Isoptericola jiangsuensis TaxID=548579 RepID=UPI001475E08C|nr:SIR2 family protein [Isoptericola jiangsuensis]